MESKYSAALINLIIGITLTACSAVSTSPTISAPPATQTVMAIPDTAIPTYIPSPTIEKTSLPYPTRISPSQTPYPTPTVDPLGPTPTVVGWRTSEENGLIHGREWIVFQSNWPLEQYGAINIDGTGITWFDLPPDNAHCVRHRKQYWNNWLAYHVYNESEDTIDLIITSFPNGEIISRVPIMMGSCYDLQSDDLLNDSLGTMSWSPDGQYIALSAMSEGDTNGLYLYKRGTNYLELLRNEKGIIQDINWGDKNTLTYSTFIDPYEIHANATFPADYTRLDWSYSFATGAYDLLTSEPVHCFYRSHCARTEPYIQITDDPERASIYDEAEGLSLADNPDLAILSIYFFSENGHSEGVFLKPAGETEEIFLDKCIERALYCGSYHWIETAQRFVGWSSGRLISVSRTGDVDSFFYETSYGWRRFTLSGDESMVAYVPNNGRLSIYELNNGYHEIWEVDEPIKVRSLTWLPNNRGLIVEGLGNVYYLDLQKKETHLLFRDGEVNYSIHFMNSTTH